MWLSRDLDMERARTADLSMSMSRPAPIDPYRHLHAVSPSHPPPHGTIIVLFSSLFLLKLISEVRKTQTEPLPLQ